MTIGVNTTLNSNGGSISILTGGTWTIDKGKTLTLNSVNGDTIGAQSILAGQTINVVSAGSGDTNAILMLSGAVTNSGTLKIGSGVSMTISGSLNSTTINNEGSITIAEGTEICLDKVITETTSGLYTSASFSFATGTGNVEWRDNCTFSYMGFAANVILNQDNKGGTASFSGSYYYIAGSDTVSYATATSTPEGSAAPTWITVSENGTLSLLPSDTVNGDNRTSNIGTAITGSGTISMNAGSGQVTIAADKLTKFTGELLIESGRFNEIANGHVFSKVTVNNGGQFCINDGYNYTGDVSISGTGWNESNDVARNGALRLGQGSTLSGILSLSADASICVHSNHGTIASSANWTNKVTKVGVGELWLTGSVNIGDVDVSAGTFSLGKLEGPMVDSQQIAVGNVTVNAGSTFSVGYTKGTVESVSLAENATLRYYDNQTYLITVAENTTTIKKLTVSAAANLQADWKGTLNVSELTGAGNLSLTKYQGSDDFYLNISSIKDYSGTISGPTQNGSLMTVTIGGANISDAASTATVSANVTLKNGFTKTGAGAVSFGGTTTATDVTVSSGSLTFAGGTSISKLSLNGGTTTISGATSVSGVKGDGIIATSDTIKLTVSDTGTLTHDGFQYTGTELSGLSHGLTLWNKDDYGSTSYNVSVTGGTITQTQAEKTIHAALSGVKLINGTDNSDMITTLGANANLSAATIAGKLIVEKETTVTGAATVSGTAEVKGTLSTGADSSITTLTGSGTLKANGGTTEATNASGFTGTLDAAGGDLTASGGIASLTAVKATGGNITLQGAADLTLTEVVVSSGKTISAWTGGSQFVNFSAKDVRVGEGGGSLIGNLSINNNGTLTLNAVDGTSGTGLSLSYPISTLADVGPTSTSGSLTLGSGLTLNLLNLNVKQGDSLTLFSGVTGVNGIDDMVALKSGSLEANTVFTNLTAGDFMLSFDETNHIVALVAQRDVPEPTTATLSLLALMGLAARRRRRKA